MLAGVEPVERFNADVDIAFGVTGSRSVSDHSATSSASLKASDRFVSDEEAACAMEAPT